MRNSISQVHELIATPDKLILVAVPQVGTLDAAEVALHGDGKKLGVFLFTDWGFILDEQRARGLAENMHSAYHQFPTPAYFTIIFDPPITMDPSVTRADPFIGTYGP